MVQEIEVVEVDIDGRTFWVRPAGSRVLQSNNVVAEGLAVSLDHSRQSNFYEPKLIILAIMLQNFILIGEF